MRIYNGVLLVGGIAFASILVSAVGGCKLKQLEQEQQAVDTPKYESYERIGEVPFASGVYKFKDLTEDNVCYFVQYAGNVAIECMVSKTDPVSR